MVFSIFEMLQEIISTWFLSFFQGQKHSTAQQLESCNVFFLHFFQGNLLLPLQQQLTRLKNALVQSLNQFIKLIEKPCYCTLRKLQLPLQEEKVRCQASVSESHAVLLEVQRTTYRGTTTQFCFLFFIIISPMKSSIDPITPVY